MIPLIAMFVIAFGILGFRIYRLLQYYKEAHNNPIAEERHVAYKNYIIHLIFCAVLLILISGTIYGLVLAGNGEV